MLVRHVHAGTDQAELGHRAVARDEPRVGGATARVQPGLQAGDRLDGSSQAAGRSARRGQERLAADRHLQAVSLGMPRHQGAQPGLQGPAGMKVVEADVQPRGCRGRHQVGCRVADIDAGDLQAGALEPLGPLVERGVGAFRQRARQAMHRIVHAGRVGHVALRALHGDAGIQAAAPADLDDLAQSRRVGRLPHQAEIRDVAVLRHPLQHPHGAAGRRPLLIPRDEQADGACPRRLRGDGSQEGRYRTLHVARAATVDHAIAHHSAERIGRPGSCAGRDHVSMAGKAEMRRDATPAGEQIGRAVERHAVDREAQPLRGSRHQIQRARIGRRDGRAADQRLRQVDRVQHDGRGANPAAAR